MDAPSFRTADISPLTPRPKPRSTSRSPSTRKRDETIKRRLYERFGVSEYWVVDPEIDTIKVFRQVDGRYARVAELFLEHDDVLSTPLLPDLTLPLAKIFED